MEELVFFDNAKEQITNFFEKEFEGFPSLLMSHFLNRYNDLMNYLEEDKAIKPVIIFTDNIEAVIRAIPKSYAMTIFEDSEATMFNNRLKSILAIAKQDWCLYIDIKENKITYGLVMWFGSIKDKRFSQLLQENSTLKERNYKVNCVMVTPLNFYTMLFHSISGNRLIVNFSLDKSKNSNFSTEVNQLVNATFSKLRTTQRKLQDMKNLYLNIFTNVMNNVKGTICVIVDKDYVDTGLFEDGIWLKEPISFRKLFTQSKSYSEEKLNAYADLFLNMLNYDGITIIDNLGRLRAYNVFVEPNSKRVGYIVGGARKRAAYYILSTRKKGIVGVYFQSHEGEVFFQSIQNNTPKKPKTSKQVKEKVEKTTQDKTDKPSTEKVNIKTSVNENSTENKAVVDNSNVEKPIQE